MSGSLVPLASVAPLASGGPEVTWQMVVVALIVGIVIVAASWVMTRKAGSSG